ncbi:MAG: hypothetical protein M3437_00075 [Chloroflexota bacterium]|nr:hypothetical protein [Chloroflexota bacterium]MDQ5864974.1 hypothetical protein [Chloroflexota bacterium]
MGTGGDRNKLRRVLEDVGEFSNVVLPRWTMREYQARVAREIADSVMRGEGRQFAVAFARQSGKDEMLAQLEAFLMCRYRLRGGSIIVANPTLRPQGLISRRRLAERLRSPFVGPVRSDGHSLLVGRSTCAFLSAGPTAQARGETATLLLACNEAQDVSPARWDSVFDPMGASAHATQVFSGTVWTSRTLLARQMAYLGELERKDGRRRVFKVGWEEVAQHVPEYGEQVRSRIAQFGRDHPFIRTEYFLEEMDAEGKLFGPARRAQMRGDHPRQRSATPGRVYAMLLDVAGAEEEGGASRGNRDATALTVVEVDLSGLDNPLVMRPRYRVVDRRLWVGTPHPQLHSNIVDLARNVWQARHLVVDATGVGAGLAGFLGQALPGKVVPFVFSSASKSQLGWDFVGLVESGRYKEYAGDEESDTGLFWAQVEACEGHVGDGPGKPLRWGVESRSTHDDLLVSAALCAVLDRLDWVPRVARGR